MLNPNSQPNSTSSTSNPTGRQGSNAPTVNGHANDRDHQAGGTTSNNAQSNPTFISSYLPDATPEERERMNFDAFNDSRTDNSQAQNSTPSASMSEFIRMSGDATTLALHNALSGSPSSSERRSNGSN
ncbi:hypothetical protein K469DRAFT_755232 [Zopfia rhizophila CBS 207.26]|uniref:Uncharacterized protein n=1 Tax=Zopfia rhizophila CBS 207.26 TaxID=1314779 RepID=A0A6A6DH64_9PEZI|nr:hypothetical protein K469DRAFT_755232 [Zopfia rhizophila CBS 207.26]